MKKQSPIALIVLTFVFGSWLLVSCGGSNPSWKETKTANEKELHEGHAEQAHYVCPMDCENGKVYDQPGACPKCKMDLALVE
jgi:hypothetical protein